MMIPIILGCTKSSLRFLHANKWEKRHELFLQPNIKKEDYYRKKSSYFKISSKKYYHDSKIYETKRSLRIIMKKNTMINNIIISTPDKKVYEVQDFKKYTK